jgi:hypothetical protein
MEPRIDKAALKLYESLPLACKHRISFIKTPDLEKIDKSSTNRINLIFMIVASEIAHNNNKKIDLDIVATTNGNKEVTEYTLTFRLDPTTSIDEKDLRLIHTVDILYLVTPCKIQYDNKKNEMLLIVQLNTLLSAGEVLTKHLIIVETSIPSLYINADTTIAAEGTSLKRKRLDFTGKKNEH